jgi:hypothetical protein
VAALRIAVRVGVVACVAAACLLAAGRLDSTVAIFDFQADANSAAGFNDRVYPEVVWLPAGATVLEDARLWMPENAAFRVIHGSGSGKESGPLSTYVALLLWPRTVTDREPAAWVFCHGCTAATLGPDYEILSDSGHGFLFARRES